MPREHHASHQKTGLARALLAFIFCLLAAGNYALFQFGLFRGNPFPAMPGLVVGSALASLVMLVAIWIRKPMARTALVVFLWIMMFLFSMPGLIVMSDRSTLQMDRLQMLAAGLAAYLVANFILIVADPIHRLGAKRGCGSR